MNKPNTDFSRLAPVPGTRVGIIGGCGGIGQTLIRACLDNDLRVINMDQASAISQNSLVDDVVTIPCNAAEESDVQSAFAQIGAEWGGLDVMIHLAGFTDAPTPVTEIPVESWDEMIAVNLRSAYLCARAAIPLIGTGGNGSIVYTASGLALNVEKGVAAYSAAKAGLISLTKVLAKENAPHIRVNAVAPGAVDTAFMHGGTGRPAYAEGSVLDRIGRPEIERTILMGRIAVPEDVVGPMLFLAGNASAYMTGQVLHINGGRYMP